MYKIKLLALNIKLFVTRRKILCSFIAILLVALIATLVVLNCRNTSYDLTKQEMVEDYDEMKVTLQKNYPYFNILKEYGIDYTAILEEEEQKIKDSTSKNLYFKPYYTTFEKVNNYGGLAIWDYWNYKYEEDYLTRFNPDEKLMLEIIKDKDTSKSYHILQYIHNVRDYMSEFRERKVKTVLAKNFETQIIEEGKIAYIHFKTFDREYVEEDKETLLTFFQEVKDYDNVILDVQDTQTGISEYFSQNIVAPNISEDLTANTYLLFKSGDNNMKFMEQRYSADAIHSTAELTGVDQLRKEDRDNLDQYVVDNFTIKAEGNQPILKGKVWLLTSEYTYGVADKFADFCRKTGFAKVVGKNTAGSGLGMDPVIYQMPHSKLIIQYRADYPLNIDGSCNLEIGTTPDILANNENILDNCINIIKNGND